MYSSKNCHRHPRYGIGSLRAWIHARGLVTLLRKRHEVVAIDFNHRGMAFRSPRLWKPGETLVLDLVKDAHRLQGVVGVVRAAVKLNSHYRCGIEFDFEANDYMRSPETMTCLQTIETLLRHVVVVGGVA
jgi:hypothetical protein